MAFRGRSRSQGPNPAWLDSAADLRLIDLAGDDDSTLVFQAPTLGTAALDLYRQQELWPSRPDPSRTGLDLLGDVRPRSRRREQRQRRLRSTGPSTVDRLQKVLSGSFHRITLESSDPDVVPPAIETPEVFRWLRSLPIPLFGCNKTDFLYCQQVEAWRFVARGGEIGDRSLNF